MANKTFQIPSHLSMSGSNENFKEKVDAASELVKEHLVFLQQQLFCVMLQDCLETFPQVQEMRLTSVEGKRELYLHALINGGIDRDEDAEDAIIAFLEGGMGNAELSHLKPIGELIIKKDNIKEAWAKWMGEENWVKWQALDTADELYKIGNRVLDKSIKRRMV